MQIPLLFLNIFCELKSRHFYKKINFSNVSWKVEVVFWWGILMGFIDVVNCWIFIVKKFLRYIFMSYFLDLFRLENFVFWWKMGFERTFNRCRIIVMSNKPVENNLKSKSWWQYLKIHLMIHEIRGNSSRI